MKLAKWQIPLTIVLFISGILLVTALRALTASEQTPWHQKNKNLVSMIKTQEREIAELEADIEAKREDFDRSQRDLSAGKKELKSLQARLEKMRFLAGLTPVEGEGIIITLDDNRDDAQAAQSKNPEHFKPEDFLIHDKHILYIINELRVGGAEAISVNDQRIISLSDIRCVGPMILVNTTRLAPPYIIKAIGEPSKMTRVLESPESEYNILKMAGFPVSLESNNRIEISPYKGSYQFSYAQPVKLREE